MTDKAYKRAQELRVLMAHIKNDLKMIEEIKSGNFNIALIDKNDVIFKIATIDDDVKREMIIVTIEEDLKCQYNFAEKEFRGL